MVDNKINKGVAFLSNEAIGMPLFCFFLNKWLVIVLQDIECKNSHNKAEDDETQMINGEHNCQDFSNQNKDVECPEVIPLPQIPSEQLLYVTVLNCNLCVFSYTRPLSFELSHISFCIYYMFYSNRDENVNDKNIVT